MPEINGEHDSRSVYVDGESEDGKAEALAQIES